MELAFYAFSVFFLSVTLVCLISLYFSDSIEKKVRRVFRKKDKFR
jgi:hypothetical protein